MRTARRVTLLALLSAAAIAGAFALAAQGGRAHVRALVYSVKFLCSPPGFETAPPIPQVEDGHYTTVINVHNPNADPVVVFKKVVSAGHGFEDTHAPGAFARVDVQPDFAFSVNCDDLKSRLPESDRIFPLNFDGFVVIVAPLQQPLDVTAVYTTQARLAPAGTYPPSIEVVQVQPTETDTTPPTVP